MVDFGKEVMTKALDPKVVTIVIKLVIIGGLTTLEAIEETSRRTGISKSAIRKLVE